MHAIARKTVGRNVVRFFAGRECFQTASILVRLRALTVLLGSRVGKTFDQIAIVGGKSKATVSATGLLDFGFG